MNRFELPSGPGSYRWYYLDVTAGDFTAVVIFMVGSIFSPRYSSAHRKGGEPREHAAVNFALYEKGVRWQWVLSEYQQVALSADGRSLSIGGSSMSYSPDGRLVVDLVDKTPVWGRPTEVRVELVPEGPGHPPLRLVEGLEHWWRPIAPRARATVLVPRHGLTLEGRAYHDGNHGEVPLGSDLRGWDWVRVHEADRTTICYRPWHPATPEDRRAWQVDVSARSIHVAHQALSPPPTSRTAWGLRVPANLGGDTAPALLESSPFYARLESHGAARHTLGEVADFRRFHSPWVRWMAGLRTRVVRAEEHAG